MKEVWRGLEMALRFGQKNWNARRIKSRFNVR